MVQDQHDEPIEHTQTETKTETDKQQRDLQAQEARARQLSQIVCICKGINLGRILKVLDGCETVADVNRKAGTGSGGCQGERCGPRIKILLRKMKEAKDKKQ